MTEPDATVMHRALAHPIRVKVLQLLQDRVASPNTLAREMDMPLGRVSYHVRDLLANELVELVRVEPRRGALEHYYRATVRVESDEGEWRPIAKQEPVRDPATARARLAEMFGVDEKLVQVAYSGEPGRDRYDMAVTIPMEPI